MGGAAKNKLTGLEKTLKKVWRKIGPFHMHTNQRQYQHKLLNLSEELQIQESKLLWRWNKKIVPKSILSLIEEKNDRLRGRRFVISRNLRNNSINTRLTKRANKSISCIANAKSLKVLATKLKNETLDKYNIPCRIRNCYTCSQN
jgi:hypothetical protein